MTVLKNSSINSKNSKLLEEDIYCLQCEKHLITILKLQEEEFNRVNIICVCGCETPVRLIQKSKIYPSLKFKIDNIIYDLLSEKPRSGESTIILSRK